MKIGDLWRRDRGPPPEEAPRGPWSDLPPPAPPPKPFRFGSWRPAGRRREPIITNWRGLLIVLFLLLVAPFVARVASGMIMSLFPGH